MPWEACTSRSPRRRGRLHACGFAALAVALLLTALPASASHYRLRGDLGLLRAGERAALARAGVKTTRALLDATASRKARKATHAVAGIAVDRLEVLATQCDLLRIRGLGPSAVLMLQAAGVAHTAALGKQAPGALHGRLEGLKHSRSDGAVVPSVSELSDWIGQAKRLPKVLEGIR